MRRQTTRRSHRLQSAISLGPDRRFPARQLIGWGDPADGAVKTDMIVVLNVPPDNKSQTFVSFALAGTQVGGAGTVLAPPRQGPVSLGRSPERLDRP